MACYDNDIISRVLQLPFRQIVYKYVEWCWRFKSRINKSSWL